MIRRRAALIALLSAALMPRGAIARDFDAKVFMPVLGSAPAPVGYVDFCHRHSDDCHARTAHPVVVTLNDDRWLDLIVVNRSVNDRIAAATDMEVFGIEEYWDYPVDRGDCEDYVLLKRRELMQRGWPASALLITVVRDEDGAGHAVLTVRTDRGDLVLDNKVEIIRPWFQTPYSYIKRQSPRDASAWDRIDDRRPESSVSSIKHQR